MTSDKIWHIIYDDLKSLIKKVNGCANNQEKSSTTKIVKHIPWGYSILAIWAFDIIERRQGKIVHFEGFVRL